jgi:hypoxanthine-DNA glycosylase
MLSAASERDLATGFLPVVGRAPRVLILGSLPGRASIEAGEYYASPQNAFWKIMGALCGAEPELAYAARLDALGRAGIALWDVLHAAVRPGSLDASIVPATQQTNDIAGLLARHATIRMIGFNGLKATTVFRREVGTRLPRSDLALVSLPSTSPAHARLRPAQKLARWREALAPHLRAV